MASLKKNVASQNVTFCLINASTGAALTGATVTTKITKDGTQGAGGGSVTEMGFGQYNYAPSQSDTNATDVGMLFTATSAIPVNYDFHTDIVDANGYPGVNIVDAAGTAVTLDANNTLNVSTKYLGGTLQTARDVGASVLLSSGTGTGQISLSAGKVAEVVLVDTLTTYTGNTPQTGDAYIRIGLNGVGLTNLGDTRIANLDAAVSTRSTYAGGDTAGTTTLLARISAARAGYLDNLSAGAVALASGVTVTTNNDKTGYALTQAFPSNFSSFVISAAGIASADMKKINGTTINGDGSGTPFGP